MGAGLRGAAAEPGSVLITEFMADNVRAVTDEDGNYSDWLELYNPGLAPVNLGGWYLTDAPGQLAKWQFPGVSIPSGGYLVVFASGKNRAPLFGQLHTNFKLNRKDGYLALVASNGVTVVSEIPGYPAQVPNISYGIPVQNTVVTLVATNAPAQVLVPADDHLAESWTAADFPAAGWKAATNGIGYETDTVVAVTPVVLADSVKDFGSSGTQGVSSWYYGYWDRAADADGVYAPGEFVQFPRSTGAVGPGNFYTNGVWHWYPADAAPTEINRFGGVAAGDNGAPGSASHWAIRRWVSKTNALVRISGMVGDRSSCADGSHGDGIVARILIDGVEVYQKAVHETSVGYSVTTQVKVGSNVDFVIDPGPARSDDCDNAAFTGVISTTAPSLQLVSDSMAEWSDSGLQGQGGWQYGYSDRGNDATLGYQAADFIPFADVFWNDVAFVWPDGAPPYDTLGRQLMHPNSPASPGGEHWVIRRWVSKLSGTLVLDWHFGKVGTAGSGLTLSVYHKASGQTAVPKAKATLAPGNVFGTNLITTITGVQQGDPIDFIVDASGVGGLSDDVGDDGLFDVRIFGPATLAPFVATDMRSLMQGINSSVYARFPFTVANPSLLETLTLSLRFDSGFIAYLNGNEVLRRNVPDNATWNSAALLERMDADAEAYADYNLSSWTDLLVQGQNVLAIHAMNSSAADSDMLLQARLTGGYATFDTTALRYFSTPTPGAPNGAGNTNLGPIIFSAQHQPNTPKPGQSMRVTATVLPSFNAVSNVQVFYQVMYGARTNLTMFDDGLHDDGAAGDGVYAATIPADVYQAGNMVRYYIRAVDVKANETRDPNFTTGQRGPEFWGTVVENASLTNPLPVLHWFSKLGNTVSDSGGASSIFYNGQFLDNVTFSLHGQSSLGFPKHSFNVNLNPGYKLTWSSKDPAIHDINLMTTYPDKAHIRNILAYNSYRDAGTPYHFVFPIRVQLNGQFWGDAHFMENGDNTYLARLGLDENGAFYKMYDTFESPTPSAEKKTRRNENNNDLAAFYNGLTQNTGTNLLNFVFDNVNLPEVVNYLATMTITANTDCCHKNYYFYRDTEGTGEWQMLPWDQDLSFGRVWSGAGAAYFDDTIYVDTGLRVGGNNTLPRTLFSNPYFDQMYLRRLRTLMEELLQTNGTPAHLLKYETEIDQLIPPIIPDAALDLAKWGTWSGNANVGSAGDASNAQSVQEAANLIKFQFLPGRRTWLFNNSEIPKSQPAAPALFFGALDYNPASGNQDEEYFTIINTNKVWIDISHWRITGAVDYTFQGGVVIPTNTVLYVSPNVKAFRNRATGPHAGQRLYVQGNYKGHLSARGEGLQLVNTAGQVIASTNYPGAPSAAQRYLRITELMYHPAAPEAGSPYGAEDFEYVELKNTGPAPLSLAGVRFVNGIAFDFTGSAVTQLGPGQSVLVVHNAAAFGARYGAGLPVAGQYTGALSNSGDTLRLVDASGEVILDFAYNNSWYPITDGLGFSLAIASDSASWDTWGLPQSWRPSGVPGGTPGTADPGLPAFVPVVVNEVLSHSEAGATDAVELWNPTQTPADIGGWYLSDDFLVPTKYRLPLTATLAAGGFRVVRESEFNPGGGVGFALGAAGDDIYLFSADKATGRLTGYYHGFKFGPAFDGMTFGPQTNSVGEVRFVRQSQATLGLPNSGAAVGPAVISEIMYHPVEQTPGKESSKLEYIEVLNVDTQPLPLFHPLSPTDTWRLAGGAQFQFPTNVVLPAGSRLLVVNFDPATDAVALAAFRTRYGTPAGVAMFGPYSGQLNNAGDKVELQAPDRPDPVSGVVSYVTMDAVHYLPASPWPVLADGYGPALIRYRPGGGAGDPALVYGDDPGAWIAGKPSPGYTEASSGLPVITTQPADATPLAGDSQTLTVVAGGSGPFAYQWIYNGEPIDGATAPSLTLNDLEVLDWGAYQVVVMNGRGSVLTSDANVIVRQSVVILKQPVSRNVLVGSNVVFSVTGYGTGGLHYQWLYNDLPITGAISDSYKLTAVTLGNEGVYRVRITDDFASRLSAPATLAVYDRPRILVQPQPISLLSGEDATFGVAVSGRGPLNFQWRKSGAVKTNFFGFQNVSVFTVRGVTSSLAGQYSVVITNLAGATTSSVQVALSILADFDNDHMADVWEVAHKLATNNAADALLDSDGDGVKNVDEYRADTDPMDPSSYLKIDRLTLTGGASRLEFFARSNRSYTVEFREAVDQGLWQTLTNVLVQTNSRVQQVVDPYPLSSGRIYRLATPALIDRAVRTPVILESPLPTSVLAGTPVTLSTFSYGTGTLRFQWYKDGQALPGATASTLSFGAAQPDDQGDYSVTVTDDTGSVSSAAARLLVLEPPVILAPPSSASVPAGSPVQFSVKASGNSPLSYRWLFHDDALAGATGPVFSLAAVTAADAGLYRVVVRHNTRNGPVSVESDPVELAVLP